MNKTLLSLVFALVVWGPLGLLRAADDPQLEAVRAADDARVAAFVAGDEARLMQVLSRDLRYVHASGNADTRTTLVESITSGRLHYTQLNYEQRDFTFPAPGIALMQGRLRLKVTTPTGDSEAAMSFLGVWRLEEGTWRFLAWQSSKLPGEGGK